MLKILFLFFLGSMSCAVLDNKEHECIFDLDRVRDIFKASLVGAEDVDLDQYLEGFKELIKFCDLMGSMFSFVSSEISEKIKVLEDLRNGEQRDDFATLFTMTDFETTQKLLVKKDYTSGSRTLLRLHRGLDFIRTFLEKLGKLNPDDSTSSIGREAYTKTLASYHSFFIRQGAYIAMYTLPTQKVLLQRVCKEKAATALAGLPAMLQVTNIVYDRVQAHYKAKDLLELP
nr:PREDICTED: ceramide-1-phosphate transfer protein isoform X1 [Bemisia tabaci]